MERYHPPWVGPPTSADLISQIPHSCVEGFACQVILDGITLAIEISHRRWRGDKGSPFGAQL